MLYLMKIRVPSDASNRVLVRFSPKVSEFWRSFGAFRVATKLPKKSLTFSKLGAKTRALAPP